METLVEGRRGAGHQDYGETAIATIGAAAVLSAVGVAVVLCLSPKILLHFE